MSTLRYPRRARRDFRGVLDESLFLYMKFKMNKYLRNCGCCHVLQSIGGGGGGGGIYYYYYLLTGTSCNPGLRCDVFFYANLNFHCIERFMYTIASLF